MSQLNVVQAHYMIEEMSTRLEKALHQAGLGTGQINWSDLAPLDQLHIRGLAATKELAEGLGLSEGEQFLDVGSGLGGPARYLAAVHGCRVTGIELTPSFVDAANQLTQRTGLSDRVQFVQGDALNLPFPVDRFDHVWTQHVAMNIQDKERLYHEIYRVLKPGGQFAIYDAVEGENEPVIYPTPWASDASISFLVSPTELTQILDAVGFSPVSTNYTTHLALSWFAELQSAQQNPEQVNPLNPAAILGPQLRQGVANFAQNIKEGRVRLMQVIVQKNSAA